MRCLLFAWHGGLGKHGCLVQALTLPLAYCCRRGHLHELGHMHHGNYRVPSYFGEVGCAQRSSAILRRCCSSPTRLLVTLPLLQLYVAACERTASLAAPFMTLAACRAPQVSNVFYAAYVYGSFEYGPTMLRPGGDYGWNYWSTRMARRENLLNESNGFRGNWEVLKEEPWLMLDSIVLLLESPPAAGGAPFGWTLLRDTMASYSSLTASQRAAAYASDQRKLEAFVRQLSTTAGAAAFFVCVFVRQLSTTAGAAAAAALACCRIKPRAIATALTVTP